jgi:5-methylcytosine-specific restriction protein B
MESAGLKNRQGEDFVVVIDEANRANLPRVLGELMFLFEYRNEPVRLQYSGEFELPENLRFIATMNTADRSIRSIDVALRRRFEVFELAPDPHILDRHYANGRHAVPGLVDGFRLLNETLTFHLDRHHTIGHALLMRERLDGRVLTQIWQRKIFPLVEEFFFDQPELIKEFTLERFWPAAADDH